AADTQNDADIWVQSDRFALGVAICEMVVWSDEVDAILRKEGRGQLLPDDIIMKRDLARLPKRLIDTFPDGFLLLDRALHATGPASMPSPEDWLRVLGFDEEKEFQGRPVITVYRTRGNSRAKYGTARLLAAKGDLSKVALQLADLAFQITDAKLEFRFPSGPMVKRRRNGRLADVTSGIRFVVANPGDTYYVGEWELEIADRVDPVHSAENGGRNSGARWCSRSAARQADARIENPAIAAANDGRHDDEVRVADRRQDEGHQQSVPCGDFAWRPIGQTEV